MDLRGPLRLGLLALGCVVSAAPLVAQAQDAAGEPPAPVVTADPPASEPQAGHESHFHDILFDDVDGKFDVSEALAEGGFTRVPIIITEPAVDGGFGLMAQFVTIPEDNPRLATRRIVGALKTGNGSYGVGYLQSGFIEDGKIRYRFGAAHGKITLTSYPRFLPGGLRYTNRYDFAVVGSARVVLGEGPWSVGPLIDFRQIRSKLDFEDPPIQLPFDFNRKLNTGAFGVGLHYDTRDNVMTPRNGLNAYVEAKYTTDFLGSDREFQGYKAHAYAFRSIDPKWHLGMKVEVDAERGDYPSSFAPAINLRGVQASRFQGASVVSSEFEVSHEIADRWSLVAFAGVGATDPGSSRVFGASGAKFAGGGGFRYRLARLIGLDAGLDLAYGPDGAVFYLQFGHAWASGMD